MSVLHTGNVRRGFSIMVLLFLLGASGSAHAITASSIQDRVSERMSKETAQQKVCAHLSQVFHRLPIAVKLPAFCIATPPPPPTPTVSLDASPSSITLGATTTLAWTATNATTCTAGGAWSGSKSISGSEVITPTASSTYSLTCTGAGGSASDSAMVTVTIPAPLPTVILSVSPGIILEGATSTLSWSSTDATSCIASDGWSGAQATSGNVVVSPVTTTVYTLTCTGPGGSAVESTTLTVQPIAPLPTVTFEGSPLMIASGASTTLTWSSTNTTSCTASNGWNGAQALSGSLIVTPVADTTYTLTCRGAGGEASDTVVIDVVPLPTVNVSANPGAVLAGATTTLTWTSTDATSCTASLGWTGTKALSGSEVVTPTETTSYLLSCSGIGGEASASTSVTVTPLPTLDHVVMSEVYYDVDEATRGTEPAHEWIELYNPTNALIALGGWSIQDTSTTSASTDIIPGGITIAPQGFVILTASSTLTNFWTFPGGVPIVAMGGSLGNGLGNTGDSLVLRNTASTTVDAVSWGSDVSVFDPAAPDVVSGHSLARLLLTSDTDTAADWEDRVLPTPGF